MSDRSIAAHWRGVYAYDQTFNGLTEVYADTEFEMHLTIGWFGRFTGKVLDSESGITEPASIQGRLTKSRIIFRKTYVSFWVTNESGKTTVVPGQPPYTLYYTGEFIENRNSIKGRWEIRAETRWINGERWDFPRNSGTWTAQACIQ